MYKRQIVYRDEQNEAVIRKLNHVVEDIFYGYAEVETCYANRLTDTSRLCADVYLVIDRKLLPFLRNHTDELKNVVMMERSISKTKLKDVLAIPKNSRVLVDVYKRQVQGERLAHIEQIADAHDLKLCRVVEVSDLPSAFVCGILRPVLAIPAISEANNTSQDKAYAAERGGSTDAMDEKVLLHELFHLKHRDTFWSALICLLRCIHWCNPLLAYCADRALNDMESRCDQYVLEHLAGCLLYTSRVCLCQPKV